MLSDTFSSLYPGTAEQTAPFQNVSKSVGLTALLVYFSHMGILITERKTLKMKIPVIFVVSLKVRCSGWKQM